MEREDAEEEEDEEDARLRKVFAADTADRFSFVEGVVFEVECGLD